MSNGYDNPSRDPYVDKLAYDPRSTHPQQGQSIIGGPIPMLNRPQNPQSLIEAACEDQAAGLNDLHKTITELEYRLVSVLTPEPPNAISGGTDARVKPTLIVERIAINGQMGTSANHRLRAMLNRLQV